MNFYRIKLTRFHFQYQQVKALFAFSGIILPMLAIVVWTRLHVAVLFHAFLLTMGWLTWTFLEYMLHRFWQHRETAAHKRFMLQSHQNHHLHPTEIRITAWQRLYMLLILMACCMLAAYLNNYFTYVTGLFVGLAGYMYLHKFLHTKQASRVFKRLFRYHLYHHCKYPDTCFGISTTIWDDLLGTVPSKTTTISPRVLAFYLSGSE
jgi:hypothetical protein